MKVLDWCLDRLVEPSTWQGFFGLLSCLGVALKPELTQQIASIGVGLISIIHMVKSEK